VSPPSVPPRAELAEWLATSPTAAAIGEVAGELGWLAGVAPGSGNVVDLEAAMRAVGVGSVETLEATLAPELDDIRLLLTVFRQRRGGSTRGDLAHWVAVCLLGFAERSPEPRFLPAAERWSPDYVAGLLDLRRLARRGELAGAVRSARVATDGVPEPLAFRPPLSAVVAVPREDRTGWPIFSEPGSQVIVDSLELTAGEVIRPRDYRVLVRRPHRARAGSTRVLTVPVHRLEGDGELRRVTDVAPLELTEGQPLDVVGVDERRGVLWIWLGEDRLAELPRDCCTVPEGGDTMLWLRVSLPGSGAGWTTVPESDFERLSWREWRAARGLDRPRLGDLGTGETGAIDVDGTQLLFWRAGGGEEPPVVVLHGGPGIGSAYLQGPLTELLGGERQLLFYDQRGSGYSGGVEDPERLTMERLVGDLDTVRRRAGLESMDLLGHSFGGLLAIHYSLEHPARVGRLILVDPDPATRQLWERHRERVAARTSAALAAEISAIEEDPGFREDPDRVESWLGLRMRAYVAEPADAERIEFRLAEPVLRNLAVTPGAIREDLGDWDLRRRLAEIRAPTLIVAGRESVFPAAAFETLRDGIPDARLVLLAGCGHLPFMEAPETFAEVVRRFLQRA
ncbi:MAG: alpha/beta fold hydrolase, partial [Acidobacteriota bacterium]